jgi:Spy/CpxP family protein refolding chaperone
MTVTPRLWLATFLALVFMVGVSAGVWIDRVWLDDRPGFGRGPGPGGPGREGGRGGRGPGGPMGGPPPERLIADLDRELDLNETQEQQIRQILDAQRATIQQLQNESRERFNAMQRDLDTAIAAVLTPDQVTKFKDWASRERSGRGRGGRH